MAILFRPVSDGGFIDLRSRLSIYRLQTVRLLYHGQHMWPQTAFLLLSPVKNLGHDRHLFLLDLEGLDMFNTYLILQVVTAVVELSHDN